MYSDYPSSSPPSSPPSSPSSSSWTQSSSPLSSSTFLPLDLTSDDVEDLSLDTPIDPLAGSYHASLSRKRTSHVLLNTPPETPSKKARFDQHASPVASTLGQSRSLDADAFREKLLWEDAIEAVFESGERKIDLVGKNITHIPPNVIRDLSKIVLLPETGQAFEDVQARLMSTHPPVQRLFGRTRTAPASTLRFGPQGKTMSSNSVLGASRETMDLLLGQNNITKLPVELWRLQNLTLLSLRNNNITYLPPEIGQLTELVELNVAHNKLQYIPSELLSMKKLKKPFLFPNPYLIMPAPRVPAASPPPVPGKPISETHFTSDERVPLLTELCLRALLSPPIDLEIDTDADPDPGLQSPSRSAAASSSTVKTRLEQTYELPLRTVLSPSLQHTFGVCVPGSVLVERDSMESPGFRRIGNIAPRHDRESLVSSGDTNPTVLEDDSRTITGIGVCPNPAHGILPSVFVHHAEERFTWETSTPACATLGGAVAMRWRGCMRGCLDFLDPPQPEVVEVPDVPPADTDGVESAEDGAANLDLDEGDIVQTFAISMEPLGFE